MHVIQLNKFSSISITDLVRLQYSTDLILTIEQVACFPFDDHNCPPIHIILLFCQSCYSWLKENILNVVVVHCKAGRARTGLMICSLLLYLKVNLIIASLYNSFHGPTPRVKLQYLNSKLALYVNHRALVISCNIFLQLFATAEECIDHYNQKRCVDGKGLIKPSQIVS